jgi:hypothetical protein
MVTSHGCKPKPKPLPTLTSQPPSTGKTIVGPSQPAPPQPQHRPQSLRNKKLPDSLHRTSYIIHLDCTDPRYNMWQAMSEQYIYLCTKANLQNTGFKHHLITGHWSRPAMARRNFVHQFAGVLTFDQIRCTDNALKLVFNGTGQGIPCTGFTNIVFHGVPCRDVNGTFISQEDLLVEINSDLACHNRASLSNPRWMLNTIDVLKLSRTTASVVWAFYDKDKTGFDVIAHAQPCLFGRVVRVERYNARMSQCDRCLGLNHMVDKCHKPKAWLCCKICGKGHLTSSHKLNCPCMKTHHPGLECNCCNRLLESDLSDVPG